MTKNPTLISPLFRRLLIIYLIFHLFALITSTFNIDANHSDFKIEYNPYSEQYITTAKVYYYFTGKDNNFEHGDYKNIDHFWPNINFSTYEFYSEQVSKTIYSHFQGTFWGIFKGYDLSEFLVYSLIPFLFILIKKLW